MDSSASAQAQTEMQPLSDPVVGEARAANRGYSPLPPTPNSASEGPLFAALATMLAASMALVTNFSHIHDAARAPEPQIAAPTVVATATPAPSLPAPIPASAPQPSAVAASPLPVAGPELRHEDAPTPVAASDLDPSSRFMSTDDMMPLTQPLPQSKPLFTRHLSGTGPRLPEGRSSGFRLLYAAQPAPPRQAQAQTAAPRALVRPDTRRPDATLANGYVMKAAPAPALPALKPRGPGLFSGKQLPNLNGQMTPLDRLPAARNIVVYMAPWCPWCHKDAPVVQQLRAVMGQEGVSTQVIVGAGSGSSNREFARELGAQTLIDDAHEVGVHGYPAYMLVDQNGNVLKSHTGAFLNANDAIAWAR